MKDSNLNLQIQIPREAERQPNKSGASTLSQESPLNSTIDTRVQAEHGTAESSGRSAGRQPTCGETLNRQDGRRL